MELNKNDLAGKLWKNELAGGRLLGAKEYTHLFIRIKLIRILRLRIFVF